MILTCPHCFAIHSKPPRGMLYGKCVHCGEFTQYGENANWSKAVSANLSEELSSLIQSVPAMGDPKKNENG